MAGDNLDEIVTTDIPETGRRFDDGRPDARSAEGLERRGVRRRLAGNQVGPVRDHRPHGLLDEPFSTLDSLTRFALQDTLLQAWEQDRKVVVMVTHDVDEARSLADRLILMTDGPAARVGEILAVPFPRPRERAAVLEHPEYYACHQRVIEFLEHHAQQSKAM